MFAVRALALALVAATVMTAADPIRVMTFNVRYPNPEDGPNYWENRKDLVVETIEKYSPDVFGTQELFYSQGRYIAENATDYDWFGVSRRGNHEDEHMGVFYKRDKLFVLESGNFWLSETPDVPASESWDVSLPRMVTWARFLRADGGELWLYNTHFPHRRDDAAARVECAKVIVQDIRKRVPADADLILMGDFNSAADSDVHAVFETELADVWATAPKASGPTNTTTGWTGRTEGNRIDWIFYRGSLRAVEAETVDYNENGRYPSDHYPVFSILER